MHQQGSAFLDDKLSIVDEANQIMRVLLDARMNEKGYIISNGDPQWMERVKERTESILSLSADIKDRFQDPWNREQIDHVRTVVDAYGKAFERFGMMTETRKQAEQAMITAANVTRETGRAIRSEQRRKMELGLKWSRISIGISAGACVLLGIFLSWYFSGMISKPMNRVIRNLGAVADQVASTAHQVSASSQSLSETITEQAASVEETSAVLDEMNARSRETAELTHGVEVLMNENIEKSASSLKSMVALTKKMNRVESDSSDMGQIIASINDIAFQTKLLGLNAAIEAAQAGEAGSGFDVVASEVRNLATKATTASEHTRDLLETNIRRFSDVTMNIKNVNIDFETIIESATVIGEKSASITRTCKSLSGGIDQVSESTRLLDQNTQQLAAGSEESAAASQSLAAHAVHIQSIIGELISLVRGVNQSRTTRPGNKSWKSGKPHKIFSGNDSLRMLKVRETKAGREVGPSDPIPLDDSDLDF